MKRKANKVAKKKEEENGIIIPDALKACFNKVYKRLKITSGGAPEIKWVDNNADAQFALTDPSEWFTTGWSILGGFLS